MISACRRRAGARGGCRRPVPVACGTRAKPAAMRESRHQKAWPAKWVRRPRNTRPCQYHAAGYTWASPSGYVLRQGEGKTSMRFKPPTMLRKHKLRGLIAAARCARLSAAWRSRRPRPARATRPAPWSPSVLTPSRTSGTRLGHATFGGNRALGSYNATNPVSGAINESHHAETAGRAERTFQPHRPSRWPPATAASTARTAPARAWRRCGSSLNAASANAGNAVGPSKPGLGCVDIARSSSGPDIVDTNTAVDIQYVPFALDAVTGATGPTCCTASADNCPTFTADLGNGSTMSATPVPTHHHPWPTASPRPTCTPCTTAARPPRAASPTGRPGPRPRSRPAPR